MSAISNIYVPDSGPTNAKILLVGESPGADEERELQPFVGTSGQLLMSTLERYGVQRNEVRLGNLCHYRPAGNKFEILLGSARLEQGINELRDYILATKPTVIAALGGNPLFYLTGKSKKISFWRGSILPCIWDETIKVIPTFHPSFVSRDRKNYPTFDLDIKRICEDSLHTEFKLPQRNYIIDPRGLELEEWVERICNAPRIALDIETTKKEKHVLCFGAALDATTGVCIVNHGDEEFKRAVRRILESKAEKIFHFGTFDTEVLHIKGYGDTTKFTWDTLAGQHVLAPELPRGLDYLASIYTREPYYKSAGRAEIPGDNKEWGEKFDRQELYRYNAKDCCVTYEVFDEQRRELRGRDKEIFDFEMSLIPVAQSMARNGLPVDLERRALFVKASLMRWKTLQVIIDHLMGQHVNVNSPALQKVLYVKLGLPVRKHRDGKITTDEDAVVATLTYILDYKSKLSRPASVQEWELKYLVCKTIIEIRGIRKLLSSYLLNSISPDNRVRSIYKYSNTDTGRGASEKYIDGTGLNAQTFPRGYVNVPDEILEFEDKNLLEDLNDDIREMELSSETELETSM